ETAAIIAEQLGIGPVMVDERLRERDVGEWSGLTNAEIHKGWPGFLEDGRRPAGFEDVDAMLTRVLASFEAIQKASPGGSLLVVTHGGLLFSLAKFYDLAEGPIAHLAGLTVRVTEAGPTFGERLSLLDGHTARVTQNGVL
ncbi:MAG: histidine phosphatase family protein, partial [Ilumatobacteraceae bacterium]